MRWAMAGPSGLIDTLTNSAVVLSLKGGAVEGRSAVGNILVFTITVDASGAVTLTRTARSATTIRPTRLSRRFGGGTGGANLVTLTATIEDGDGDTDTAAVDITTSFAFEDDGPSITASGASPTLTVDETDGEAAANETDPVGGNLGSATLAAAALFNRTSAFGADGFKDTNNDDFEDADAIAYALRLLAAGPTGLVDTLTVDAVTLHVGSAGIEIEGRNAGGQVVFTLTINADSGATDADAVPLGRAQRLGDPDEPGASAAMLASNLISVTATVTDGDGDQVSADRRH